MKLFLLGVMAALFSFPSLAADWKIESHHYGLPNQLQIQELNSHQVKVDLDICCYFPSASEWQRVSQLQHLGKVRLTAGYYPGSEEVAALAQLPTEVEIVVLNALPGNEEIQAINQSKNIKLLKVKLPQFPIPSEVSLFNQLTAPLMIDLTMKELPLPLHMKHLQALNDEVIVGFHHAMVPGIGYANFFNALPNPKEWTVAGQFPWGDDYLGFNALKNSKVTFIPQEKLMPQDVEQLNLFNAGVELLLDDQAPYDDSFFELMGKLKVDHLQLVNDVEGRVLSQEGKIRMQQAPFPMTVILK